MNPKDIFWAKVKYDKVDYPRPCVIIQISEILITVGLISSSFDLYNPHYDFLILPDHDDFKSTGLKRKSFVKGYPFPELTRDKFLKSIGRMSGKMADDFEEWLGG